MCAPLDCDDDDAERHPGAVERCDGLDNDCDGFVDEGFGVGSACTIFGPAGCQAPGVVYCGADHVPSCALRDEVVEHCNGLDDDCDGLVDEGNPGGGAPCDGGGVGACSGGTFQCVGGMLGCLAAATPAQNDEICNGVDDDCDGVVDEAPGTDTPGEPLGLYMEAGCYGGPVGTADVGLCATGTWTCVDGIWSACLGEVRPLAPKCDETDDADCDGVADNVQAGCTCTSGPPDEPCYTGPAGTEDVGACVGGVRTCVSDVWSDCDGQVLPVAETCNAVDDDCDGLVDEDFDVGAACTVGSGACASAGVRVCAMEGLGAACDAVAGAPGVELCNGLDDDCDGVVDEVPGEDSACTSGLGLCARPGVFVCDIEAEGLVCNATPGVAVDEVCNGLDDDCDGVSDEDFPDLGEVCTVGVGACVRQGTFICSPVSGAQICDVQPGGPSAEVCDGLDNDCDGTIDEGFGVGNPCVAPGVCGAGMLECGALGQAVCSTGPLGSGSLADAETCNSLDDDCDGLVDETFYGLGESCMGCQAVMGIYECQADGIYTQCSTSATGSAVPEEICGDSVDNDCDGDVDEGACVAP